METSPKAVLHFWFQDCRPHQWFRSNAEFDQVVLDRFGKITSSALKGELTHWEKDATSALALVLMMDQFTRQIWRHEPRAFAGDAYALRLTRKAIAEGWIAEEPERVRRQFWLMPMLHSEDLAVIQEAITHLERWSDPATVAVASRNKNLIQRFGRYPQRNAALGRASSNEELKFLKDWQSRGKRKRSQSHACDQCSSHGPIHYRVKTAAQPHWQLACPSCWNKLQNHPGYQYGGTRKANRRDRQRRSTTNPSEPRKKSP
jgi:uncharacterized protein (DUF924 family)